MKTRNKTQEVGRVLCVHKAWGSVINTLYKTGNGVTCNPSTWEVEAGGSKVQSHPQPQRTEASLV